MLVILYFVGIIINTSSLSSLETFKSNMQNDEKQKNDERKKVSKIEADKKIDERVENIKNVVLGTINKFKNINDTDYKKALLENKQSIYNEQRNRNSGGGGGSKDKFANTAKEETQNKTIEQRVFDPSSEEDTNLLITKEVLQDIINRIEYNYENTNYLKKYIKHRIEEIVDINNLIEE
jgi:hypothetical protein